VVGASSEDQVVLNLWPPGYERETTTIHTLGCGFRPSHYNELSTQNWSGQGESDSLIKTKHCDGHKKVLTQCDFCPVL
jgi:hypothetical protein